MFAAVGFEDRQDPAGVSKLNLIHAFSIDRAAFFHRGRLRGHLDLSAAARSGLNKGSS